MRAVRSALLLLLCRGVRRLRPGRRSHHGLQVQDVSTGWFDAGIVNGQNKLVPSITFRLKNISDQKLVVLQVQRAVPARHREG